jgi:hypothetical protein
MSKHIVSLLAIGVIVSPMSCIPAKSGATESRPVRVGTGYYNGLPRWSLDGSSLYFLSSTSEFGKEAQTDVARWVLHSPPTEVEWLTDREFVFHLRPSNVPNLISLVRMTRETGDNVTSVLDISRGTISDIAVHKQRVFSPYVWQSGDRLFVLDSGRVYEKRDEGWVPLGAGSPPEECQNTDYERVFVPGKELLVFLCARKDGYVRLYDVSDGTGQEFPLGKATQPYDMAAHLRYPIFALAVSEVWKTTEPAHRILIYEWAAKGWNLRASIPTGPNTVRFVGWAGDVLVWQEISLIDPDFSGEGFYRLLDGKVTRSDTQRLIVGVSEGALFFVPSSIKGIVRKSGRQIWVQPVTGGREKTLLLDAGQVRNADISPDGKWIAAEVREKPFIPYAELWVIQNPLWQESESRE